MYQIDYQNAKGDDFKLIEIGPRLVLQPIRVLSALLKGETLYKNENFISSKVLRDQRREKQKQLAE